MQHVVFNQKGGVGKSTITCNLAAISAWQGLRTLVIDLDSQGNSTRYLLGADMPEDMPNVAEFFEQSLKFTIRDKGAKEFIVHTQWEGLDVMPSSPLLDELHSKLESRHKIYKLRDALELLAEDYDQIYIDTPPALNFYTRCALIAAQGCLIPFDCDDFSRRVCGQSLCPCLRLYHLPRWCFAWPLLWHRDLLSGYYNFGHHQYRRFHKVLIGSIHHACKYLRCGGRAVAFVFHDSGNVSVG